VAISYNVILSALILSLISFLTPASLFVAENSYAQTNFFTTDSNNGTSSSLIKNVETKKVHVGDIDMAYKIIGKGKPLMLIA
jgi:hypothetical protein